MSENTDLKNQIRDLEMKNLELSALAKDRHLLPEFANMPTPATISEVTTLKLVLTLFLLVN